MAAKVRKRKPSNTQTVTTGTVIRLEEPNSDRKPRPSKTKVIVQEVNPVHGFFDFLREHAVLGLIIGFVVGGQVTKLVQVLVDNIVNPLTYLLYGQKLSSRTFTMHFHGRDSAFGWGALASAFIVFIIVLIILYVTIKLLNLDELEKKDEDE